MLLPKKYLFIWLCQVIMVTCRIQFPHQNWTWAPLLWGLSLAPGPPRAVPEPQTVEETEPWELMSYDAGWLVLLQADCSILPRARLHPTSHDQQGCWKLAQSSGKRTEQAALWPLWSALCVGAHSDLFERSFDLWIVRGRFSIQWHHLPSVARGWDQL